MSHIEYEESKRISAHDYGFYALIMAAMRHADTSNIYRLQQAFPEIWAELEARYNAPGGIIPSDYYERRPVITAEEERAEMDEQENTTECAECGSTILKEDAVEYGGGDFCTQECADTHELEEVENEESGDEQVPPPMQSKTGG